MVGEMMDKVEEHNDIEIDTKVIDIKSRKWWMAPVVIGSFVIGLMAIIITLAVTGVMSGIVEIFK